MSKNHHLHVLFGWEVIQATPNRDPYSNLLRPFPGSGQIMVSAEHLKHHWRRGIGRIAPEFIGGDFADKGDAVVFYMKEDDEGNAYTAELRRKKIAEAWGLKADADLTEEILRRTVDTCLFGFVSTVKKEKRACLNCAMPLYLPTSLHDIDPLMLGVNNAFPGDGKESAGSSMRQMINYGLFCTLLEFDLRQLAINTKNHVSGLTTEQWVDLALKGLLAAYTDHRCPSVSQRGQHAAFMYSWMENPKFGRPDNPAEMGSVLGEKIVIETHGQAAGAVKKLLPGYFKAVGAENVTKHYCHPRFELP